MIKDRKGVIRVASIIGGIVMAFGLMLLMIDYACKYSLCFRESVATFNYDIGILGDKIWRIGGVAQAMSLFVIQWCASPASAMMTVASVLTLVAILTAWILHRVSRYWSIAPLAVLPAAAQVFMLGNIEYSFSGVTAMLLMLCALCAVLMVRAQWIRLTVAFAVAVVLWFAAGQVAVLFVVLFAVIEIVMHRRWLSLVSLVNIVAVYVLALIAVRQSAFASMSVALTPEGYYTAWIEAPDNAFLAWAELAVAMCAAVGISFISPGKGRGYILILCLAYVAMRVGYQARSVQRDVQECFVELSYYIAREDWDEVVRLYKTMPQGDATLQNCVNLALAEKSQLANTMLRHQNNGVAALYNAKDRSRYAYMLLSDIYYSMGLISTARRYAFEANEAVGNHSPRMLKRLVDTNLITGDYKVAEKYINILASTAHYASWAESRRLLLHDDKAVEAHPDLGPKRACLIPDNRFMGQYGIDDDLRQVLKVNPKHKITLDYLGMIYLLGRNVPKFMAALDEARDNGAVTLPLPEHFQEAVAMASFATGDDLATRYQIHPSVLEKCQAFWQKHQPQPNTLWQYLRSSREKDDNIEAEQIDYNN